MRGKRLIFAGASLAGILAAATRGATSPTDTRTPLYPEATTVGAPPAASKASPNVPVQAPRSIDAVKLVVDRRRESGFRFVKRRNSQPWVLRKRGGRLVAIHLTHGRR